MVKNSKRRLTEQEEEIIYLAREVFKLDVTRIGSLLEIKDEFGNLFEIKQTTKTSFKIETYVTPKVLSEWRRKYWIFAEETGQPGCFCLEFANFCTPKMMEPKFIEMEKKLSPDVKLFHTVMSHMSDILDKKQFKRLEHLLDMGTETAQKHYVSMEYLGEHSLEIDMADPDKHLKKLVAKYPIKGRGIVE
jgi:hypothetical protein